MLDACIQNFFRVSALYRVGGGKTARKFWKWCTVLRLNRETTEKYEYYSTVPRIFVQDCLNPGFGGKSLFSSFFLRFLGILETSRWSYAIIMTFETIFSTQKVFTRQFPDEPYRAHSRKLEPSTAGVGQARCFEHRAQYSVAKTHCILNIRYKFIKETRLRYISTKK